MASKGDLYLNNASVIDIYDVIKAYETTVTDAFYSQYKNSFKISKSNYFRRDKQSTKNIKALPQTSKLYMTVWRMIKQQ